MSPTLGMFPDHRSWWMIVIWVQVSSDVKSVFTFSEAQNEAKHTLTQVSLVWASKYFDVPLYVYFIMLFLIPVLATLMTPDNCEGSVVLYSQVQTASTKFAIFLWRWQSLIIYDYFEKKITNVRQHLFRGDWSWNNLYGHSLPSADSRRAVVSYLQTNVY